MKLRVDSGSSAALTSSSSTFRDRPRVAWLAHIRRPCPAPIADSCSVPSSPVRQFETSVHLISPETIDRKARFRVWHIVSMDYSVRRSLGSSVTLSGVENKHKNFTFFVPGGSTISAHPPPRLAFFARLPASATADRCPCIRSCPVVMPSPARSHDLAPREVGVICSGAHRPRCCDRHASMIIHESCAGERMASVAPKPSTARWPARGPLSRRQRTAEMSPSLAATPAMCIARSPLRASWPHLRRAFPCATESEREPPPERHAPGVRGSGLVGHRIHFADHVQGLLMLPQHTQQVGLVDAPPGLPGCWHRQAGTVPCRPAADASVPAPAGPRSSHPNRD